MKFENLKLWLSLPLVFYQYRREVNKKYREDGASGRCRFCAVAAFAVTLAIGTLLYNSGFPQSVVSQFSAFAANSPESVPAVGTVVYRNP